MRLDLWQKRIVVRGAPSEAVPAMVRLFGGQRGQHDGTAILPLRSAFAFAHFYSGTAIGDDLRNWMDHYRDRAVTDRRLSPHLWDFQRQFVLDIIETGRFGVFSDAGSGKTTVFLECARHCGRTLIITPPQLVEDAYQPDAHRWYKGLTLVDTTELTGEIRDAALRGPGDVFFVSPYVLGSVMSVLKDVPWGFVAFDESSAIRRRDTTISREAIVLSECAPFRAIGSANPAPNGIWELFPQIGFLDESVYEDWGTFCKTYSSGRSRWPPYYVFEDRGKNNAALRAASTVSRRLPQRSFWRDRPKLHVLPTRIRLGQQQLDVYRSELAERKYRIKALPEDLREAEVRGEQIMALREITAGFRYRGANDVDLLGAPKMRTVYDILRRHGRQQAIIWCEFRAEYDIVTSWLDRWGVTHSEYTGQGTSRESRDALRAFKARSVRVLIANPQSAGHGLRLEQCRLNIFHSIGYNADTYYQAIRRTYRPPQRRDVYVYLLLAHNTIDEVIYNAQRRKAGWREVCEEVLAK